METFEIKEVTVRGIMRELSEQMGTEVRESFTEYEVAIPPELGKGFIQGLNFPNGVGMVRYEGCFHTDVEFQYTSKVVHPLKILYCVEGEFSHAFTDEDEYHDIEPYQSAIVSSHFKYGHIYRFNANKDFYLQTIEIDRAKFQQHIEYRLEDIEYHFYKMFADVNGVEPVYHDGYYSLQMANVVDEIRDFDRKGLIRINFLGAKALELITLMLIQYEDDFHETPEQKVFRKKDLETIYQVEKYLEEHLENSDTIDELSSKFHLNANKLQEGFQLKHNKTVNEYIVDLRLKKAIALLEKGEMNISEIVYSVGLTNRSYFAKIFKEKFNVSPSQFRKINS